MKTPILALIRKDFQLFFSDRRAVIMSFVAPILIAAFFGYVFGGNGGKTETSRISVLVADQDGSKISQAIAADLTASKSLEVKPATVDAAREAVRKGNAAVAIVIPKDFGTEAGRAFFRPEKKPEIGVLYDPSHSAEQGMVQGILTGSVMQIVSKEMFSGESGDKVVKDTLSDLDKNQSMLPADKTSLRDLLQGVEKWNGRVKERTTEAGASNTGGFNGGLSVPYQLHEEAVTAKAGIQYNGYAHSFGGMSVQFILFHGH